MKFSKMNMNLDWKLEIKDSSGAAAPASEMHEIYSFVQPALDDWIYACGYVWDDPTLETYKRAVTMKVSTDGQLQFLHQWGTETSGNKDACRAVNHDSARGEIVFMIEATSPSLRPDYSTYSSYSGSDADMVIVVMRSGGSFVKGYNINMNTASVSLGIGTHSFYIRGDDYIFGGQSFGYKTKVQNSTYDVASPYLDSYVFKYNTQSETTGSCFYQAEFSGNELNSLVTKFTASEVADYDTDRYLFRKMGNVYLAYSSRYSGSFDLGDTLKYPKMCVDKSINMTDGVTYYRGQKEFAYVIGEASDAGSIINMMDGVQTWMYQNGTDATKAGVALGRWARYDNRGTIYV
jgi:hypothetical protein